MCKKKENTELKRDEPDRQNRKLTSVHLEGMLERIVNAAEFGDLDSGTHKKGRWRGVPKGH